ncbi:MAG: FMN-binding negative transcriptional regulator [Hyphomonadaceae bacterium]|nr:FMN-binding negative transcriptional regulator [Hyphomonadaceae bacterium]
MSLYAHPLHQMEADAAWRALAAHDRLAILVVQGTNGFEAVHAPILAATEADGHQSVKLHVARANGIWRAAPGPAMLIAPGPQAYVTPSAYETKRRTGRAVPTWNYEAVHAWGDLTAFDDADALRALVAALSDRHEAGRPEPWALSDAPEDYTARLVAGIVGLSLRVTRIVGKAKLSQEKPAEDFAGVVQALTESPDPRDAETAAAMRRARS